MSSGDAGTNFLNLPALGASIFMCVALHCSGEFFDDTGISFNIAGCSDACERATCVAVWCGTNGLANFPVIGSYVASTSGWVEGMFGGRAAFLMTMIILDDVAGELWTFGEKPHTRLANALYKVTGVSRNSDATVDSSDNSNSGAKNGLYDLSNANINTVFTLLTVIMTSIFWNNSGALPNASSLTDGSLFTSVTSDTKPLHTGWPFSLMLTMHVVNSVRSSGGYWASDLIQCCFAAYGGLMMKDLLGGKYTMPFLFADNESALTLVLACWYFVNHNIPYTNVNAWETINGFLSKWVPVDRFMDLCTLSFNCSLLIATATSSGTGSNFLHMPALGHTMFMCVALHCAGEFFSPSGITFNVKGCSNACNRAAIVAFWCGTDGLGAFPFIGTHIGGFTSMAEGYLGGRSNFLMSMILMHNILGGFLKFKLPHEHIQAALYKVTGVNAGGEEDSSEESKGEEDPKAMFDMSNPNIATMATTLMIVGVSILWNHGMSYTVSQNSLTDGSLFVSVTSNEKPLSASHWPFSLMMTMHVLNMVRGHGRGFWASDIINCCFGTYGGLMMSDLLNGNLDMPFLFGENEGPLMLLVVCWYVTNHNVPFTSFNLWKFLHNNLSRVLPLDAFMNLCSLAFNCSLLINTAMSAGSAGNNFLHMPAVASTIATCVALHCAGDFFNGEGLTFSVPTCSAACERATWVAFWCATNGLATLPFVGPVLAGFGTIGEDFFGGRANFLMSTIILDELAGHMLPYQRPHTVFANAMYKFFGI